ncbi:MAG: hypothetical protein ABI847_14245, partial [Anaerolineales bacterium]
PLVHLGSGPMVRAQHLRRVGAHEIVPIALERNIYNTKGTIVCYIVSICAAQLTAGTLTNRITDRNSSVSVAGMAGLKMAYPNPPYPKTS